jgi:hypothetical protein
VTEHCCQVSRCRLYTLDLGACQVSERSDVLGMPTSQWMLWSCGEEQGKHEQNHEAGKVI